MRTTLTLDPDLAARLKELAHRRRASFKDTVNEVIRRGLTGQTAERSSPFVVEPHRGGFLPGVDPHRMNQLVDELEVDDTVAELLR